MSIERLSEAIGRIDEIIPTLHTRNIIPSDEMLDLFLDLRNDLRATHTLLGKQLAEEPAPAL